MPPLKRREVPVPVLGRREEVEGSGRRREKEGNILISEFPRAPVINADAPYRLVPSARQQGFTHLIPSSLLILLDLTSNRLFLHSPLLTSAPPPPSHSFSPPVSFPLSLPTASTKTKARRGLRIRPVFSLVSLLFLQ